MEYSPGDFLDRHTILAIKKDKGLDTEKELEEMKYEYSLLINVIGVGDVYNELYRSNYIQYELEDKIRVEKDLKMVGQYALDIRERNDRRVELKNKINYICGYKFKELKLYNRV